MFANQKNADNMHISFGGIAQLVERLHGMQEVSGSIPLTSTKNEDAVKLLQHPSPHRLEA